MSLVWLVLVPLFIFLFKKYRSLFMTNVPLPPGPPADPFIGHIRSIPRNGQDIYFYELGLKYGDVLHLHVMGQSMVILNSVRAASELLDKRGANYSDRPYVPVFELMLGVDLFIGFLKYGTEWRKQRAILQNHFSKDKSKHQYRPIQTREARILTQNLLSSPDDKFKLLLRFSTSVIIDINYGHRIVSEEDPYLKIVEDCSQVAAESGPPGATPIDLFPFLRHFPSWFPGTHYAKFARDSSHKFHMLFQYPYDQVKEQMAEKTARPSILSSLIEELQDTGVKTDMDVKRIQSVSAASYIAGADTTSSTLSFFLLAMVLYPELQSRAQEQIDRVVGVDRLPDFQDRDQLPFIECLLQETMRWHQAVPTGVPHKSTQDDVYNGLFIPKGSLVIANTRAMTLDETVYKDPFKFDPARFLPSPEGRGEPHPIGQFGFGRRICPGRYLAEDSVWIVIATILATTTISRAIGKDGEEIIPEDSVITRGIASHPKPFLCDFKPRNKDATDILRRSVESN